MNYPDKAEMLTKSEDKQNKEISQLTVSYYFKCCSCLYIALFIIFLLTIWLPFLMITFYSIFPYKKMVIIDEIREILILFDKALIPCCKLNKKTFFMNSIKKVIIYITWTTDTKIGFNKIYFINCELISTNDMKEILFEKIENKQNKLNEILEFFRKHFDTEFKPAEDQKNPIEENNMISAVPEKNEITQSTNEDAAKPVYV